MYTLRPYQQQAVNALIGHFVRKQNNPCVVIPTGGGKSVIMAEFIRYCLSRWPALRFCVVAHVQELVEQNCNKLLNLWPFAQAGIYSAGLKRKEGKQQIVFASIQSIWKKTMTECGAFDVILIDEAHRIPEHDDGMYRTFLADQASLCAQMGKPLKIAGFTATPYRTGQGKVCKPENILNEICLEVGVRDLIEQGFLSRPMSAKSATRFDFRNVTIKNGEFAEHDLEQIMLGESMAKSVEEILAYGHDRKRWIVFCVSVKHARAVSELLSQHVTSEVICAKTPKKERAEIIKRFNAGEIKALCNVAVLTEGFDSPEIDLIAMLRPTKSPGLYYQICGRGLRLAPGKTDCLVLDFGKNISRHGPIDAIRVREPGEKKAPVKACPECGFEEIPNLEMVCPECGYVFPESEQKAPPKRSEPAPIADRESEILSKPTEHAVTLVSYRYHHKPEGIDSLRIDYTCGFRKFSEWICLAHEGWARVSAVKWWQSTVPADENGERLECPRDIQTVIGIGNEGLLLRPHTILVDESGKYPRILSRIIDPDNQPEVYNVAGQNIKNCPDCGCAQTVDEPGSGPHHAAIHCAGCGKFLRWRPKPISRDQNRMDQKEIFYYEEAAA